MYLAPTNLLSIFWTILTSVLVYMQFSRWRLLRTPGCLFICLLKITNRLCEADQGRFRPPFQLPLFTTKSFLKGSVYSYMLVSWATLICVVRIINSISKNNALHYICCCLGCTLKPENMKKIYIPNYNKPFVTMFSFIFLLMYTIFKSQTLEKV